MSRGVQTPLDAPLALPPGDWTDLELGFDAPVQVTLGDDAPALVALPTLLVPLEDPEARVVTLDWSLPEGAAQALQAGVVPNALAQALDDGVWATAR